MIQKLFSGISLTIFTTVSLIAVGVGGAAMLFYVIKDIPDAFAFTEQKEEINGIALQGTALDASLKQIAAIEMIGWQKTELGEANQTETVRSLINAEMASIRNTLCSDEKELQPQGIQFQHYTTSNSDMPAVTFAAVVYPTGVSAYSMNDISENCISADNTTTVEDNGRIYYYTGGDSQHKAVVVSGDLILIASGPELTLEKAQEWFTKADDILTLQGCVNLNPAVDDYKRNKLYAADEYEQLQKNTLVTIDELPEGVEAPESYLEETGISDDSISGGVSSLLPLLQPSDSLESPQEIDLPSRPDSHEYWPDLPEVPELPESLTILEVPLNTKTIQTPIADTEGPGCGWGFSSYTPTTQPNQSTLDLETDTLIMKTEDSLTEAQNKYLASVVNYYEKYADYQDQLAAYEKARKEVADVNQQWLALQVEWATYDRLKAEYDRQWDEYNAKLEARVAAQTEYDAAIDKYNQDILVCQAQPTPSPTPNNGANPTIPDSETTQQTASDCPPEVPAQPQILKQAPPEEPNMEEPQPPTRD